MKNPKLDEMLAANNVPVTASVSPGLHPSALIPFAEPLVGHEAAKPALDAAMKAQRVLYSALADMTAAEQATRERYAGPLVVDGRTITRQVDEAHAAQLAADLGNRFSATAIAHDRHLGVVQDVIADLDNRIERALTNPKQNSASVAQAASDIRAFVKDLGDERRMNWLHARVKDDPEVIQAILATSGWVSGLDREQVAVLRSLAAEHMAPKDYAARQAAQKVADHIRSSAKNFMDAYAKLVPTVKPSKHAAAVAKLKEAV